MDTTTSLDSLIAQRLGERQRKLDRLEQMRQSYASRRPRAWVYTFMVAAAIALVALLVVPWVSRPTLSSMELTAPQFEEFRGTTTDNITPAIESGELVQALAITEEALEQSELEIRSLRSLSDESVEYMLALERERYQELLWAKFYILARLDRRDQARATLQTYVKQKSRPAHYQEAKELLKKI